ncbi:MAG: hypothetical protein MUF45_08015 [Spirosomaceae bacterium]|jgi:hypothetical protein|nr:hypothetical protein [Spirosomataceae bacterium]
MKKIESYNYGWDTNKHEGFVSVADEFGQKHIFGQLNGVDFLAMITLLNSKKTYIDSKNWLITGHDPNNPT